MVHLPNITKQMEVLFFMFMSPLCGKTIFYHSTLAETDGRGENKIQSRISASVLLKVFFVFAMGMHWQQQGRVCLRVRALVTVGDWARGGLRNRVDTLQWFTAIA